MIRVAISVEGQTEYEFFTRILAPRLRQDNIELTPIIVSTKRIRSGKKNKGGGINLDRIKNEIANLLPNFDYVTTFYDLYGFEKSLGLTACEIEEKIASLFESKRLIPYVQQYEFETLLFSRPEFYALYLRDESAQLRIESIIKACGGVENINSSKETSPSARIKDIFKQYSERYDKVFHGYSIAEEIGLEVIMESCNRFKVWFDQVKSLPEDS